MRKLLALICAAAIALAGCSSSEGGVPKPPKDSTDVTSGIGDTGDTGGTVSSPDITTPTQDLYTPTVVLSPEELRAKAQLDDAKRLALAFNEKIRGDYVSPQLTGEVIELLTGTMTGSVTVSRFSFNGTTGTVNLSAQGPSSSSSSSSSEVHIAEYVQVLKSSPLTTAVEYQDGGSGAFNLEITLAGGEPDNAPGMYKENPTNDIFAELERVEAFIEQCKERYPELLSSEEIMMLLNLLCAQNGVTAGAMRVSSPVGYGYNPII